MAVLAREVFVGVMMVIATLVFHMERFDVSWLGKLATFLLMFAIPGFMIGSSDFPGHAGFQVAAWCVGIPGLALSWITAVAYVPQVRAAHRRRPPGRGGGVSMRPITSVPSFDTVGPMNVPEELHYSSDHEWVGGDEHRPGAHRHHRLRPGLARRRRVRAAPDARRHGRERRHARRGREHQVGLGHLRPGVAARSSAINDALNESPQLLNEDPYGEGWICEIEVDDAAELDGLLDAAAYTELIEG